MEEFLRYVSSMVNFWDERVPASESQRDRLEGLAFSILSYIDGSTGKSYSLIPLDFEDNKFFCSPINDIAGSLHEKFGEIHLENKK